MRAVAALTLPLMRHLPLPSGTKAPNRRHRRAKRPRTWFFTLNQLNESIISGNQNVGNGKYRTADGSFRSIDKLRGYNE